jgi:hypothetical protein
MPGRTQISAYVSKATKDLVDRYARGHGVKKGHLVESALLHHLQALQDLPAGVVIPPRLVVSRAAGEVLLERIENPHPPTPAARALMKAGRRRRDARSVRPLRPASGVAAGAVLGEGTHDVSHAARAQQVGRPAVAQPRIEAA